VKNNQLITYLNISQHIQYCP